MLYVVRHGKTDSNENGRYGGRIDVNLNEEGIRQAEEVALKLKDIKFEKVFSSPLSRAYKTAEIICKGKYDIIKDERIIERSNGKLEGKLKSEIKEKIDFNDPNERRYDIECITDFRSRIYNFFDEITKKYHDKNILVVTHAGVGIYTRCYFEGEPKDKDYIKYKLKNCEVLKYNI